MEKTVATTTFLKSIPAFRRLREADLERLASQCREVCYPAGAEVLRVGGPGDGMYLILDGVAAAPIKGEDGNERFVAKIRKGEFFGEMAMLTGEPRRNDILAETNLTCLCLDRAPMEAFMRRFPSVAAFLTGILGQRLLESDMIQDVGRYRILSKIGEGGMSVVFEGRHRTLGTDVAIKMLSHSRVLDKVWCERFRHESTLLASLHHDNIIRVIDFEEAYSTFFIIMELVDGQDLHAVRWARGSLPADEVRSIISQLALALDYAHARGVIHRDIKPGNVLMEPTGRVKLMDFGISKTLSEAARESDDLLGTPEYMSPEQCRGEPMDGRSDLYSLGIMTYELLTGDLPFRAEDPLEILDMQESKEVPDLAGKVPDDLAEVVRRATKKAPPDRYAHGRDIARALQGAKAHTLELHRARTRSLTLIYDAEQEVLVDALLSKLKGEAAGIPGVHVAAPDGAALE